jgi:hypothetical protein
MLAADELETSVLLSGGALPLVNHVGLDPGIPDLPQSQVDVELAPSLSLVRRARHVHIKLVRACLLRHAVSSPQEVLQAAKSRVVANEDEQSRRRAVCCRRRTR